MAGAVRMKQIIAEVNIKPKITKTGKEYDLIIANEEFGGETHFISDWNKRITTYPETYVLTYEDGGGFKTLVDVRKKEDNPHPIESMVEEE